ncbi:MAG: hypothetical protein LBH43_14455 [Treponema sp.]|jgi:hypothetical protein|nr:hypothetical protein [Treponema sp.]
MCYKTKLVLAMFVILSVLVTSGVFCQTRPELPGFNKNILEHHFSRADRETEPQKWMEEALKGIDSARIIWEELLSEIHGDSSIKKDIEKDFTLWAESELERRFSIWLIQRFFAPGTMKFNSAAAVETGLVGRDYIYQLSDDGSILRDEYSGQLMLIRLNDTDRNFEDDLEGWRKTTANTTDTQTYLYKTMLEGLYPELLMYISDDRREGFRIKLSELSGSSVDLLRNEFNNMLAREERYLTALRTGDIQSLRRQSENDSAAFIASRLIDEVKNITDEGIKVLEKRIEAAETGAGDLILYGEEWLSQYKEQFERGIKTWEEAEERFFIRRIEWEFQAGLDYQKGEEAWNSAFTQFEEARRSWEQQIKWLFDSAETLFAKASENLEKTIREAAVQIEIETALRSAAGAERARAWADIYMTSAAMVVQAKENITYWQNIGKTTYNPLSKQNINNEIDNWKNIYNFYYAKAIEARDAMFDEFSIIMNSEALIDILNNGINTEELFLDEYQIELLRAKRVLEYWKKQEYIAEAVLIYAEDLTAGRVTAGEGQAAWEQAKKDYEYALAEYEKIIEELNDASSKTGEAVSIMKTAAEELKNYEKNLQALQIEYSLLQEIYMNKEENSLLAEIISKKEEFEKMRAFIDSQGQTSPLQSYINALIKTEKETENERQIEMIKELVAGGEYFDRSLYEISSALEKIIILEYADELSDDISDYGLEKSNPYYSLLETLLLRKNQAGNELTAGIYDELIIKTTELAASICRMELENRILQLKMISSGTSGDYSACIDFLSPEEIYASFQADMAEHYKNLLKIELTALQMLIDKTITDQTISDEKNETDMGIILLAGFFDFENSVADQAHTALNDFYITIKDYDDFNDILAMMNEETGKNQFIDYYFSKGSLFSTGEGLRLKELFLMEELLKIEYHKSLMAAITCAGIYSHGFEVLIMEKHTNELAGFYASLGLNTGKNIIPGITELSAALTAPDKDTKKLIEEYQSLLEALVMNLPAELYTEYYHITQYLNVLYDGGHSYDPLLFENAKRSCLIINTFYSNFFGDDYVSDPFIHGLIERFLNDHKELWKAENTAINDIDAVILDFEEKYQILNYLRYEEKKLGLDIANLEIKYNKLENDNLTLENELKRIGDLLNQKETGYDALLIAYKDAAEFLNETGAYYDTLYAAAKNMSSVTAEKELLFEIQDEIKRWAETAYLDTAKPLDDLKANKNKVVTAEKALSLLKGIYEAGETIRNYENDKYNDLYNRYNEAIEDLSLMLRAEEILRERIEKEIKANENNYNQLFSLLMRLGGQTEAVFFTGTKTTDFFEYARLPDNMIGLSYTSGFLLITQDKSAEFNRYFDKSYGFSNFETALLELNRYLYNYNFTFEKYIQWGLAGDYLIRQLAQNNPDVDFLKTCNSSSGYVIEKTNLNEMVNEEGVRNTLFLEQEYAWNNLSQTERQYLEFYTILTLFDSGFDPNNYFMKIGEYREYELLLEKYERQYKKEKKRNIFKSIGAFFSRNDPLDRYKYILKSLRPALEEAELLINDNFGSFYGSIRTLINTENKFNGSSANLLELYGYDNSNSFSYTWDTVEKSLSKTGGLSTEEIERIKKIWDGANNNRNLNSVPEIIDFLLSYSKETVMNCRNHLEDKYIDDERIRLAAYSEYMVKYDRFIEGKCTEAELLQSAAACFDRNNASIKVHLMNIGNTIFNSFNTGDFYEKNNLAHINELSAYFISMVEMTYTAKYEMEMTARIMEWNLKMKELQNRYSEWVRSASIILENGREEWRKNGERLKEEHQQYLDKFIAEYRRMEEAWDAAYYEGLKGKQEWLKNAEAAANNAASELFVNMMGSDAESGSKVFDVCDPSYIFNDYEFSNIGKTIAELLGNTGIPALESLLNSAVYLTQNAGYSVSGRLGGNGLWNSGIVANEAAMTVKKANEEIKIREAAKMALNIKELADESLKNIASKVEKANIDHKRQIDNIFIFDGLWGRRGNGYIKDVLVHSTFIDSMITERAYVDGYIYYIMPSFVFSTDIGEIQNGNLSFIEIQNMADSISRQTTEFLSLIFGTPDSMTKGEFFVHLGEGPELKNPMNFSKGKQGIIENYGSGEYGRLLTEFEYWGYREKNGISLMQMAAWEKPIWDSRNSSFNAPSLKSVLDTGLQVVSVAAGILGALPTGGLSLITSIALINTADDIVFGLLDYAGGYKTGKEALVSVGKAAVINTASAAVGSVFNGFAGSTNKILNQGLTKSAMNLTQSSIGANAIKAGMTGIQAMTSGVISSAISSINYSSNGDKWSFSKESFKQGLIGSAKGALVSMTGSFTTSSFNTTLEGFTGQIYNNGSKLGNLLGQLAGQGVNYALNDDFAFNIFNLGIFDSTDRFNFGLVEMHLGKNGFSMNLGTGGADISAGSMISSVKGIEAIFVNMDISRSGQESAKNYISVMRTLYSGSDEERNEYNNYLAGKTKIEHSGNSFTESIYDDESGIKTVYLGTDATKDNSRFALNVILSHEAYRTGVVESNEEQKIKRDMAVIGHTKTASALINTYGADCLSTTMVKEAIVMTSALENGNYAIVNQILENYDSSGEYWKLINYHDGTHSLVYDGNKFLTIEYLNEDGDIISRMVPKDQEFVYGMGWAQSLAAVTGLDRAEKLLGGSLDDASVYSFQTLKDVLGLADNEIEAIQRSGVLPEGLTEKQRMSLAGEALLMNSGASWNESAGRWTNTGGLNLTLTEISLKEIGNIFAVSNGSNGFIYSALRSVITRDTETYKGWSSYENEKFNPAKQALDSITLYHYDLNGTLLSYFTIDGVHTVDNMTTNSKNADLDEPYEHPIYGNIQGSTIAPGELNLSYASQSNYHGILGDINNAVLVINNAETIDGRKINNLGNDTGNPANLSRWLFHSNRGSGSSADYNSYYSDGCFVTASVAMDSMLNYLSSTGLGLGYQIKTTLNEVNKSDYQPYTNISSFRTPYTLKTQPVLQALAWY